MADSSQQNIMQRLKLSEKLSYGIGDVANGLAVASIGFWLLFYLTDVTGLSPWLAGMAIMIGRAWDAVTDPVMGWITDRTTSRWGKRRPYLLFGAFTYGLAFFSLWIVPSFESEWLRFLYVTIAFIFFNTALTVVFVPYTSLTAAITDDYNERTSLTGFRMVASQIAFLIGATVPPKLISWSSSSSGQETLAALGFDLIFGSWFGTPRVGYLIFGLAFALTMMVTILICFAGVRERITVSDSSAPATAWYYMKGVVLLARSSLPFRKSLLIKLFSTCAVTLVAVKLPYYISYVLSIPDQKPYIFGLLFISAIISTPVWVLISKRLGKFDAYKWGMVGYCVVLGLLLVLGQGAAQFIYLIAIAAGFFHAAALMIPWSIIPDVVEHDELTSGHRREGLLYGGTTFAYKLASALAVFLAGLGLEHFGYEPNAVQAAESIFGILLMVSVLPAILLLLSIVAGRGYPLTSEVHAEVKAALIARRAKSAP
jgi:GPH family glycoside/pentoside/hexuronide:cation symporter